MKSMRDILKFYSTHGVITDPGNNAALFSGLPESCPDLISLIQGLFLHIHWAERYGVRPDTKQKEHVQARFVEKILEIIHNLDNRPLTEKRPLKKRFFGNCRDFSVMLVSLLRHQGIAAVARCGFGTYFLPGKFEDHWVVEYWDDTKERWVMADPQIDGLMKERLALSFNPLDIPSGKFINAAEAWHLCRSGKADPMDFGIFDMRGLWFIRGNLLRDLAALNKMELLPWDGWGLSSQSEPEMSPSDYALLDKAAKAVMEEKEEIYSLYENPLLQVPPVIDSYTSSGVLRERIY